MTTLTMQAKIVRPIVTICKHVTLLFTIAHSGSRELCNGYILPAYPFCGQISQASRKKPY